MRQQRGVPPLDAVDRLPRRTPAGTATLWWLGVHGGAGETTLAELLPDSRAAEHQWPAEPDPVTARPAASESAAADPASAPPASGSVVAGPVVVRPVVLVCRSHARGLHAAQHALTDWASGAVAGVDLLGLVVVADAPRAMPKPLRDLARVVGGGAPRIWHLPWVEALRYSLAPGASTSSSPTTPATPVTSATHAALAVPAAARGLLRDVTHLTTGLTTGPTLQTAGSAVATREDS